MNVLTPTRTELLAGLQAVGVQPGDVLYVASSLAALGLMDNPVGSVLSALREAVGPSGTLVMPAFNFAFCQQAEFDRELTPSTVGVLTEAFRQLPDAIRTWAPPYHTVTAVGPLATEISAIEALTSFGGDSVFQYLHDINAKQLLLGIDYHGGVAHFHWLEELHQVPYRYWKKFEGSVILNGQKKHRAFFMYARRSNIQLNAEPAAKIFEQAGYVQQTMVGLCPLRAFNLRDFKQFFEPHFQQNPFILVEATGSQPTPISSPVKGIDHIAIVSKYSSKIRRFFQTIATQLAYEGIVAELGVNCQYFSGLEINIEFVDPIRSGSRIDQHIRQNPTSPLHHIAFEVTDMAAALSYFKLKGYEPLDGQFHLGPKPYQRVIFLNPIQTGGLLVELVVNDGDEYTPYGGKK